MPGPRETPLARIQRERKCSAADAQKVLDKVVACKDQMARFVAGTLDLKKQWTFDTKSQRWQKT